MTKSELESMHIAELHALAAEAGVERYRMLRREDLVESLLDKGQGSDEKNGDQGDRGSGRSRRGERSEKGRGRSSREGRERSGRTERENGGEGRRRRRTEDARGRSGRGRGEDDEGRSEEPTEFNTTGRLEITRSGEGLIHAAKGELVQVSTAQIRRCELRPGDLVEGPARASRRADRPAALVRVEKVNGGEPAEERGAAFEQLTPITPTRRIPLELESDDLVTRASDLLAPLAYGQRVLVRAERHSGRSTLLRGIARAALAAKKDAKVIVLLIDERPEEVTEWRRQVPGAEIFDAAADQTATEQLRRAGLALAAAKRLAESGEDVILAIDSLTRLAVSAGDASAAKPFFGAGRDLAEAGAGSLTVIGVVLTDSEEGVAVERAVATTESTSLDLSAELAAEDVVPSFFSFKPSIAGEELLREGDVLAAARRLRSELSLLPPVEAARRLAERITSTKSNEELLR